VGTTMEAVGIAGSVAEPVILLVHNRR
jgi:hypothetical protein